MSHIHIRLQDRRLLLEGEGCAREVLCLLEPAPPPHSCLVLAGEPQTQEVAEWCGWTRLGSGLHHL